MNAPNLIAESVLSHNAAAIPNAQRYLKQWNWGAFLIPSLWPLTHGLVWLGVSEMLLAIGGLVFQLAPAPRILGIIYLLVRILLGVSGNRIALNLRAFRSDEDFVGCENAWRNWGFGILIFGICLSVLRVGVHRTVSDLIPW